jgi:hypothetical protein
MEMSDLPLVGLLKGLSRHYSEQNYAQQHPHC